MARRIAVLAALLSLGLGLARPAAAAPALADAELPLSTLLDAPPRVYHLRVFEAEPLPNGARLDGLAFNFNNRELGVLSVVTREPARGRDGVELIDQLETDLGTKTVTRVSASRLDAVLSPQDVTIRVEESRGSAETRASFSRGRVEVDAEGDEQDARRHWPAGTLTLSGLIRIAPLLPRRPGTAYEVAAFAELFEFAAVEPLPGEAFVLRCEGPEPVKIGARRYACTLYRLDLGDAARDVRVWVDRDGAVRQFVAGTHLRATLGKPGPIDRDPIRAELIESLERRGG